MLSAFDAPILSPQCSQPRLMLLETSVVRFVFSTTPTSSNTVQVDADESEAYHASNLPDSPSQVVPEPRVQETDMNSRSVIPVIPEGAKTKFRLIVGFRHPRQHRFVTFVETYATEVEAQVHADLLKSHGIRAVVMPAPPDWETRGKRKAGGR
jgi:hypothetical protein